ncbi:inorganic diphosphatase [Dyadobacter sediminis]|nr:inorganic diphosphatase [Dyadobacter sediminis]GGB83809.1 inorganic pyrophosphatase [Dyadobacter sediminis]
MNNITAIIESPKGSGQKYDYDPEMKLFRLVKILPAGMVFPFDFGFIPQTLGEDGDPLDIIVISEFRSFPGCVMECRIIGAIKALQTERNGKKMRNDRFLGVPVVSELFRDITGVNQLPERVMEQLRSFFKNYNEQAGKEFDPFETIGSEESFRLITEQKG